MLQVNYNPVQFQFVQCSILNFPSAVKMISYKHFDAQFFLLYLHPVFTIEHFLDKNLDTQLCDFLNFLSIKLCAVVTHFSCMFLWMRLLSAFKCST